MITNRKAEIILLSFKNFWILTTTMLQSPPISETMQPLIRELNYTNEVQKSDENV